MWWLEVCALVAFSRKPHGSTMRLCRHGRQMGQYCKVNSDPSTRAIKSWVTHRQLMGQHLEPVVGPWTHGRPTSDPWLTHGLPLDDLRDSTIHSWMVHGQEWLALGYNPWDHTVSCLGPMSKPWKSHPTVGLQHDQISP